MNKQLVKAVEWMTERGYSADFISRAYPYLINYIKEENKFDSTNRKVQA